MAKENTKQYIYIVQSSQETWCCKIGKTNDLERRLKEYNTTTGKSKSNISEYLFACEVKNMAQVENDIKEKFSYLREDKKREIYLFTSDILKMYVEFIKSHPLFIEEIFIKKDEPIIKEKTVPRETPSLKARKLSPKDVMQKAQNIDNDEFYTQYEDVEKELSMYDKSIWKDKCVFCNCDDAVNEKDDTKTSAFALYFIRNFKELGLKKLICTHYGSKVDLFNAGSKGYAYFYILTKDKPKGEYKHYPHYDGSFDHPISIRILKEEADIVCTNPPFSRARDYWKLIIESGKQFLIISNLSNILNTAYIPYFKESKVWAGYDEIHWFLDPKKRLTRAPGCWYTNIPINDRPKYKHLKIIPLKDIPEKINKRTIKQYDDNGILLVNNCYIPKDYEKPFAVSNTPILSGLLEKGYKIVQEKRYTPYINGKEKFARVLVQKIEKKQI